MHIANNNNNPLELSTPIKYHFKATRITRKNKPHSVCTSTVVKYIMDDDDDN